MACDQSCSCELFPLMAMEPALNLWKKHVCDGVFSNCARYKMSLNNRKVPSTLLPNGKQLAPRSREEISAAAFFNAIKKGRVPIIKSMIKTGVAKMADHTSHGLSPLMVAAGTGNVEVVRLMLNNGFNPWKKSPDGNTALDMATTGGYPECMDILLHKMKTTTPDDYERPSTITVEDDSEVATSNVVCILNR